METERGLYVVAETLVDACMERWGLHKAGAGHRSKGESWAASSLNTAARRGQRRRQPWLPPPVARVPGRLRHRPPDGTGIVHSSPAYGVDDFNSCVAHGMKYDDILNPVQGNGTYAADFPLFGGQHIWKAIPVIIEALRNAGRLMATSDITHSYRTAGATRRP